MSIRSIRAPEPIGEEFERFLTYDRLEIMSILHKLQSRHEHITLNWEGGGFMLSMLLAVNPEFEELVFDCGRDPAANRTLMRAELVTLVAVSDGIKVQFSSGGPDTTVFEGRPALRMRLPEFVLRLQRRDYYRVAASLPCQVTIEDAGVVRVLEMRAADLSLGGVALVTDKTYVHIVPGVVLENCLVDLGPVGTLTANVTVRSLSEARMRNGARHLRIGCEFVGLPHPMETLVSRFIGQAERAHRR